MFPISRRIGDHLGAPCKVRVSQSRHSARRGGPWLTEASCQSTHDSLNDGMDELLSLTCLGNL
jgi:hypothetical protein